MRLPNRAVALAALLILLTPLLVAQSSGRAVFGWVVANTLTVRNEAIVQAGGLTVADGDTNLADQLNLGNQTALAVTMNGTITPVGSYQPLTSAGTVNTASITAGDEGDLLYLVNEANTSIVLTDTGTLKLGGTRTLGQFDSLTLVSDGTNWIELAFVNN
jgi:hypothetical protein